MVESERVGACIMTMQLESITSEKRDAESSASVYRILSYPSDPTLQVLNQMWLDGEIIIPQFQRGYVWSITQASRLVESFLMGLPVPEVFLHKDLDGKHLVIDGQQRLRSIVAFFEGSFPDGRPFYLRGVAKQWDGKLYDELSDFDARRLRSSILRAIIVEQIDPEDLTSIYHLFERLNTGGTALSPQEVRNCVYHGSFNDFVLGLNTDRRWRAIMGSTSPDKRLRDVELLVRSLALADQLDGYTTPMKDFISNFMRQEQKSKDNSRHAQVFEKAVSGIHESLGAKPFHIRRGLNAAVLDSVMVAFARYDGPVPANLYRRYVDLLEDDRYQDTISSRTADVEIVRDRIDIVRKFLFK